MQQQNAFLEISQAIWSNLTQLYRDIAVKGIDDTVTCNSLEAISQDFTLQLNNLTKKIYSMQSQIDKYRVYMVTEKEEVQIQLINQQNASIQALLSLLNDHTYTILIKIS